MTRSCDASGVIRWHSEMAADQEPGSNLGCPVDIEATERLKREVLRDLDWVERVAADYRRAIYGEPSSHGLQDLEHAVAVIRQRIEKAKAAGSIGSIPGGAAPSAAGDGRRSAPNDAASRNVAATCGWCGASLEGKRTHACDGEGAA